MLPENSLFVLQLGVEVCLGGLNLDQVLLCLPEEQLAQDSPPAQQLLLLNAPIAGSDTNAQPLQVPD